MATGTIVRFMDGKGFGFIKTEDHDSDVFFHHSEYKDGEPREGQSVEFEIEQSDKGPRAANVRAV